MTGWTMFNKSFILVTRPGLEEHMLAVKAIYDENKFVLDEPAPVKGKYEVVITFTNPACLIPMTYN
jgi:hypothetical protein